MIEHDSRSGPIFFAGRIPLLAQALKTAGVGVWYMYPFENRIHWDECCQQVCNWPADEITLTELIACLHPADAPAVRGMLAATPVPNVNQPSTVECRIVDPADGRIRWIRLNGRYGADAEGGDNFYSGTMVDISDEKRREQALLSSEQQLQDMVLQSPMPMAVYIGPAMVIQLANEAMLRTWGKDKSVIGKSLRQALPELDNQPFHQLLDHVLTTGITYQASDARADLHVDGQLQTFYFSFTYKALRDREGLIYGVMNMATDVTALVLARQQTKEAEERLRTAVDLAQLCTWQIYLLSGEAVFSERVKEWLGYDTDQAITLADVLACLPTQEQVVANVRRLLNPVPSETMDVEYEIINRKTGRRRIVHSLGQAFFNEQGQVYLIVGTSQDVTAQRLTEQELEREVQGRTQALREVTAQLEQQADLLQGILVNAPTGLYVCEPVYAPDDKTGVPVDFRFVMVNPMAAELVRRSADIIIGQYLTELFPDTIATGLLNLFRDVFVSGQAQQTETNYRADGIDGWYRISVSRHGQRIVLVNTDVTSLKQAEQQAQTVADTLQAMLDGSINGIFLLKPIYGANAGVVDFTILAANRAVEQQTGVAPEDAIGRPMLAVYPGYKTSGFFDLYANALRTGRTGRGEYYYQDTRLKGWFEVSVAPQGDGLVMTFSNTTDARRTQQQLRQSVDDLRRSNDNLQQFAYVASHDLQEPLRKIQSFGDILRTTYAPGLGPQGADIVERMESAAVRMSALIKDLLSYSRLTTRQQLAEPQDLNRVMADVLNILEITLLDSQAVLDIDPLCTVPGDGGQLTQLFQNLITNALKFSRTDLSGVPTTPHIQVRCQPVGHTELPASFQPVGQATRYCRIRVIDNGIGFEPKQAERIFGTFQRLHSREKYPGTGIGLAIAKKVVENHRGCITADGAVGAGATFTVYLPHSTQ